MRGGPAVILGGLTSAVFGTTLAAQDAEPAHAWHDVRTLTVEGQGWPDTEAPFDRLPARAQATVRDPVWRLSRDSAGICVRFVSDARSLWARWTLTREQLAMPHMPATGVSGLDLYVKTADGHWRWVVTPRPSAATNTAKLFAGVETASREYLLYLPLYNGVTRVELGVPDGATLAKAPPRPADRRKPIVFYGTSITQGACASRPGMAHTAILGRRLDRPVINLGFSGNGTMDASITDLLAELDAAVYVIDCLPNMQRAQVTERTEPLVRSLRHARPDTPILLVEDRAYADAFFNQGRRQRNQDNRAALAAAFARLTAAGVAQLYYLQGDLLLGDDGEATVDGSHPTDLGFARQADAFASVLEPLLRGASGR